MDSKLPTINVQLARIVIAVGAIFALSVTGLAAMTGEMSLLMGTALGLASAGYAMQVARQPSAHVVHLRPERKSVAA
jgi:hypothetical protein